MNKKNSIYSILGAGILLCSLSTASYANVVDLNLDKYTEKNSDRPVELNLSGLEETDKPVKLDLNKEKTEKSKKDKPIDLNIVEVEKPTDLETIVSNKIKTPNSNGGSKDKKVITKTEDSKIEKKSEVKKTYNSAQPEYYDNMKSLKDIAYSENVNKDFYSEDKGHVYGYNKSKKAKDKVNVSSYLNLMAREGSAPLDSEFMVISSRFGIRNNPFSKEADLVPYKEDEKLFSKGFHTGLDLAYSNISNQKVYSILSGKVTKIEHSSSGYGNLIIIESGGMETYYAHLSKIRDDLKLGDSVKSGEYIGNVGSTGRSTGPHLHIENVINKNIAVNPQIILHRALEK